MDWNKKELNKMKKVLKNMKGLKLQTNTNEKIDEKAKQKLQEYMKTLKIENYPAELISGLNYLNNLANLFFTESINSVIPSKMDAYTSLGDKTAAEIYSITKFLGKELIYKIYGENKKPHFVEKALSQIIKEEIQAAEIETKKKMNASLAKFSKEEKQIQKQEDELNNLKKKLNDLQKLIREKEESLNLEKTQLRIKKEAHLNTTDEEEKTR